MRQSKDLIRNKQFYRMCRAEYRIHPQSIIPFKRWCIKYWSELIEAWDILKS